MAAEEGRRSVAALMVEPPDPAQLEAATTGSKQSMPLGIGSIINIKNIAIVVITAILTSSVKIRNMNPEEIQPATPDGFIKRQHSPLSTACNIMAAHSCDRLR
jgi:hypothetical protein